MPKTLHPLRLHLLGPSLTVAESDADFNRLSGSDFSEADESRRLVPNLTVSDEKASVMSLQITLFPNSGFSIGIATHHATMDGKSSTLFMKAWAYLCSNLGESSSSSSSSSVSSLPENLRPSFDRSRLDPPIPSAYFGNCIGVTEAVVETKNLLGDDGFIVALEAMSESLKRLEDEEISSAAEKMDF
ncbi:hypothetical protein K1719_014479 [Acacia pycnantha]|nr:hypothetical protein K1719_014479 [Acacia pycnantha]